MCSDWVRRQTVTYFVLLRNDSESSSTVSSHLDIMATTTTDLSSTQSAPSLVSEGPSEARASEATEASLPSPDFIAGPGEQPQGVCSDDARLGHSPVEHSDNLAVLEGTGAALDFPMALSEDCALPEVVHEVPLDAPSVPAPADVTEEVVHDLVLAGSL